MSHENIKLSPIIALFAVLLFFGATNLYAGNSGIDGFNGFLFRPNADGLGILNVDKASVLEPGIINAGSYFQYARRTISFSDPALGGLTTDIAENQVAMNLTLGAGLFKFLDVGMDIPIVLMQNGTRCNDATCGSVTNYTGNALGDIRFVIKLELMKDSKSKIGIALASDIGIPTGDRKLFTGGKGASYEQRLVLSKGFRHVEASANAGYRAVARVQALGVDYDDMATFGVAARVPLPKKFFAYATLTGEILLTDSSNANAPLEAMAGAGHVWKNGITCQIGAGTRLHDGVGAADVRTMGFCGVSFDPVRSIIKRSKNVGPLEEWLISFNSDQHRLDSKNREKLDDVIRWLAKNRKAKVELIGSADDRAPYEYNVKLAEKRAKGVFKYLTQSGVPPEQLYIKIYSEMSLRSPGKSTEDRRINRSLIVRELREGDE